MPRSYHSTTRSSTTILDPAAAAAAAADSAAAATPLGAIDYRTPGVRDATSAAGVPVSRVGVVALVGLWTLPCWLSLTSFEWFELGRWLDVLLAAGGAIVAMLAFGWRCAIVGRRPTVVEDAPLARRRLAIVAGASGVVFALHALAIPQRLAFDVYRGDFDAQRIAAGWALPPNGAAPHNAIGPYAIYAVRRGTRGEVGFHLGHAPGGVTFLWSPDDVPDPDYLFAKPTDGGLLGGGWRWLVTD